MSKRGTRCGQTNTATAATSFIKQAHSQRTYAIMHLVLHAWHTCPLMQNSHRPAVCPNRIVCLIKGNFPPSVPFLSGNQCHTEGSFTSCLCFLQYRAHFPLCCVPPVAARRKTVHTALFPRRTWGQGAHTTFLSGLHSLNCAFCAYWHLP